MNRQLVIVDLRADFSLKRFGQRMQLNIGNLTAFVAEQMVVGLHNFVKAVGNTVDM